VLFRSMDKHANACVKVDDQVLSSAANCLNTDALKGGNRRMEGLQRVYRTDPNSLDFRPVDGFTNEAGHHFDFGQFRHFDVSAAPDPLF
jgi:hypothetical protein